MYIGIFLGLALTPYLDNPLPDRGMLMGVMGSLRWSPRWSLYYSPGKPGNATLAPGMEVRSLCCGGSNKYFVKRVYPPPDASFFPSVLGLNAVTTWIEDIVRPNSITQSAGIMAE